MFARIGVAITLTILAGQPVQAQSAQPLFPSETALLFRPDAAGTRPEAAYNPTGIAIGPLRVLPKIELGAVIDSNIFNQDGGADREAYFVARPALRIVSDWGRHGFEVDADARIRRFASLEREDSEEFGLGASGRYDLDYASAIFTRVGYARRIEPRGAGGPVNANAEPSAYSELGSSIGASREFGPLRLRASVSATRRRYDEIRLVAGSEQDQSFRNARAITVTPRVDYAVSPAAGLFVTGSYSAVKSLDAPSCCARDATGGTILAGVRAELGRLVIGEVAAGWRTRSFERPQYRDFGGPTFDARIDWYPTELISFRLSAGQDIENSGIATVAGIVTRNAILSAYYDPLRNLRITGSLRYSNEKYRELHVETDSVGASLRADYSFNRNLTLGLRAGVRDRGSSAPQTVSEFHGYEFGASLGYAI